MPNNSENTEIVEAREGRREATLSAQSGVMREVTLSRFLAGGRWRLSVRWLGLAIFVFGALLLAWVFWQALSGFQNLMRPDYLSGQFNKAVLLASDSDSVMGVSLGQAQLQAGIIVIGTEFLRVLYLLLLGFLASVIAGKGIQFFAASEAIIDEAVLGEIE